MWSLIATLFVVSVADRCNFAQYQPSRIRIIADGGLQYKRPMTVPGGFAYPKNWTTLNVQGIGYSPVPTGWDLSDEPNGDFYGDEYDYIWKRDIIRMKEMGANVIRVWNWNFIAGGSHSPFLDAVFENGMFILIPFMMGTVNAYGMVNYQDLASIDTRKKIISDWKVFIMTHMNHPAVLGFLVGNEVEKTVYQNQMDDFFNVLNLMIQTAHTIESPNRDLMDGGVIHYHPITTPFADDVFKLFYHEYYDWIGISFWALQVYSDNIALNKTLSEYRDFMLQPDVFGQPRRFVPILLTERGFSALTNQGPNTTNVSAPVYDPDYQAQQLEESWNVVSSYFPHCSGMVVMEWNDEWWKGAVNDVRNPGCPNPLTNTHANCSTVINLPNGSNVSYQEITLVFEEWLGIHEQQDPRLQPIATKWVSVSALQGIMNFIAPVKQFCIRPRSAYFRLKERWSNSSVKGSDVGGGAWVCGSPSALTRLSRNPVALVIAPTVVVLAIAIIVARLRCGARAIENSDAVRRRVVHLQETASANNGVTTTRYKLMDETQELLPQATMVAFSAAAMRSRGGRGQKGAHARIGLDPHMRHLTQLIFDKIDCMSLQEREQVAKSYADNVVKAVFTQEALGCKDLSDRFQVHRVTPFLGGTSSPAALPTAPPSSASPAVVTSVTSVSNSAVEPRPSSGSKNGVDGAMLSEQDMQDVALAVQVVWFRYMEGYRLWLRKRGLGDLPRLEVSNSTCTQRMVEDMTMLILLRCVSGTMNHAPEFMMFLLHELFALRSAPGERASLWAKIIGPKGVLDRCYETLGSTDPIMSIEDFNAFGLDKDVSIEKIVAGEYDLKRKSFPERGGLHVIIVNYLWLIRLFLWLWIFAWYYQPVNLGQLLCVSDVTSTLAQIDAFLYATAALARVTMLVGSKLYLDLGLSIGLGLLHLVLGAMFSLGLKIKLATLLGITIDLPAVYLILWAGVGTVREAYLFSRNSFGEHRMQGTAAAGHGRPRLAFGVSFGVASLLTFVLTTLLTQGSSTDPDGNIASGFFSSSLVLPSFLFVTMMCLGAGVSRLVGKATGDMRSVVGLAPTLFWSLFAVICAVVNVYWLVPSVINLHFSICQCDSDSLGISASAICDVRSTVACGLAVVFTWLSTFFVSFVVGYSIFTLMSLAAGIAVAKTSQIGAVRNWEDTSRFGDKIIKANMRNVSAAAANFGVAKTLWNAFIDSMFKEHLLTARERDQYMYQTIAQRFFCTLADFYEARANASIVRSTTTISSDGSTPSSAPTTGAPTTPTSEATAVALVKQILQIIVEGHSDALVQIKDAVLPSNLPEAELRERRLLYHNISMALTLDDTCSMTTMPIKLQQTIGSMFQDVQRRSSKDKVLPLMKEISAEGITDGNGNPLEPVEGIDYNVHVGHLLLYFTHGRDRTNRPIPPYIEQVLELADVVDFGNPPRNPEAVRRIVHFLWSLDAAKLETKKREKPQENTAMAEMLELRAFHRVATMPSCSTIIPYYNETIILTWKEITEAFENGQPRVSFVEYIACQFPDEWENLAHNECWREGIKMFDRGCKHNGEPCRCGSLFLEYLLRVHDIPDEQKWRVSMFVTFRGQTLGRTLRGLESLRHGMKVLALLEERHTFEQEYNTIRRNRHSQNEVEEALIHKFCMAQVQQLVDSKYQVIVAAQVYTPPQLRKPNASGDQAEKDLQLDRLQREGIRALTFDIVCNVNDTSYLVPFNAPDAVYSLRRPGQLRVSAAVPTEGKAENQLHAVPFAIGEVINTLDMNQDHMMEMGFKHPLLVSLFWNPKPVAFTPTVSNELVFTPKYRIVGFAEHTYTRPLSMVGELMGAAEFCFVTITQRVLARPLGVRAHYGHPDYLDGYWVRTRGGGSKASHNVNVNEDIFCGYEMIARGQKITFVEWLQAQKGRESAFLPAFVFEAKLAGGAGQQVRSRDVYFLNRNLDLMQRLSVAFGTLGFYFINFLMGASIRYFVWAIILFRVAGTTFHDLGILQAKIAVAWVLQLGFILAFPLFIENCIEHGLTRGALMFLRTVIPSVFFFVFHLQTKFYYFTESIIRGKAEYMPTGRGFVLDRISLVSVYKSYGESHTQEALLYLVMLLIYRYLSNETAFSYVLRCFTIIIIVVSWFAAPLFFQPFPTSHRLEADWVHAKQWLFMPCRPLEPTFSTHLGSRVEIPKSEAETSWEAFFVLSTSKVWANEEGAYHFAHITLLSLASMLVFYVPWFVMFLLYVSEGTLYLVMAILGGQVMHLVLVDSIDPSQHHYLGVIELLVLACAVPLVVVYYTTLASVNFADIVFGACIYFVALGFLGDVATLARRIGYRWTLRTVASPTTKERMMQHRRQRILLGVARQKKLMAVLSMFVLYIVNYILCLFKVFVTAVNYSHAAAFAWERVHMQPREISVITAEPIRPRRA